MARFEKGHDKVAGSGRPKGTLNKNTTLKKTLQESFDRNEAKAIKLLDDMYNNKNDFKWLMSLKASLEPKELFHTGELKIDKIEVEIVK